MHLNLFAFNIFNIIPNFPLFPAYYIPPFFFNFLPMENLPF